MLTLKDLQAIDKLLDKKMDDKLAPIQAEQKNQAKRIDFVQLQLAQKIDSSDKKQSERTRSTNKKLNTLIRLYDSEHVSLRKRVDRIEDHLNM